MKKICFVTTVSITIKSFLLQFKDYLVNKNYDVTFICNTDESMYELCNDQVHYIPVPMKRGVGLDGLSVINKLTKIFRENKFDIIQYSTPNAALYASIAAKRAGCANRLYCQWGIRYMGFDGGIKRVIFKEIEKIVCNKSSVIECESYSIYRFSISEKLYPASKASVIWNGSACGVDLNKYCIDKKAKWREEIRSELKIAENAPVFGYVGRITRDKGANELLTAFREVVKKKNAYLLMIGMFDDANTIEADLRKWAEESKNVIFVDWTDKVEKYYSAMDVFCSLSYREGFGLVVIEAAAMGLPGIVTDVPGQVDTIEPNVDGWSVPAKNVDKVINTIEHCIDNPEEVRKYGCNARRHVEEKYEQNELFKRLTEHRDSLCKAGK